MSAEPECALVRSSLAELDMLTLVAFGSCVSSGLFR